MKRKIKVTLISAFIVIGGAYLLHRDHLPPPARNAEPMVWQEFICKDGDFCLQVPGIPTTLKEPESVLLKLVKSKVAGFTLERQDLPARFYVYYVDFPEADLQNADRQLEIVCTLGRLMKKGRLDVKKIQYEGSPGRETTMDLEEDNYVEISRLYLVNDRFYQIAVITPKDQASANYVSKYLDFFRLVNRK